MEQILRRGSRVGILQPALSEPSGAKPLFRILGIS